MTKEENCMYLLVKETLRLNGWHKKLEKTMTVIGWITLVEKRLTELYAGRALDVDRTATNHWGHVMLWGEELKKAVNIMLRHTVLEHIYSITHDPTTLPSSSSVTACRNISFMLYDYLPHRWYKNQN